MIDQLITALNLKAELSAEEIADTFLLAVLMESSESDTRQRSPVKSAQDEAPSPSSKPKTNPNQSTDTSELETELEDKQPKQRKAGVYSHTQNKSSGIPLKVPDAPSLRKPLTIARSFKPLMRRVPSGTELVLDEAATVERIVDEQIWLPVRKPALEPWLNLELVVDESISMQIWRHTINELTRLVKNYGIFRDVRVWGMICNDQAQIQIRRGIGAAAKNQPLRSPRELIDPHCRRLVLVVSDCVDSIWREGKVTTALKTWADSQPTAIVQMLPKLLWGRTALGRFPEVRLRSLMPGVPNQYLIAEEVSLWQAIDEATGVKIPVFALESKTASTWAQMLSGQGNTWTPGFIFESEERNSESVIELFNANTELTAEERVQAFRVTASPVARKLAGLLAAAPVITLPVVRLILEAILPEAEQIHVAEVFLGGLLKPLEEINADTNPDYVPYDFMDGVRELLLDSVPSSYVLQVVDRVSKSVAERLNLSLENFAAILRNPQEARDNKLAEKVRPFAVVTAQILKCLGGEYQEVAEELESSRLKTEYAHVQEIIQKAQEEQLEELDLSNLQLTQLPESIRNLTHLTKLNLSYNLLSNLSEVITQLSSLQVLDLSHNQLKEIPDSISQLTNLQSLSLNWNQIKEIPDSISQLTNLQSLSLSSNLIKEISDSISQLNNLQSFNLSLNELTEIPSFIQELTNLNKLDLRSNPLPISPEILNQTEEVEAILNFYFTTQDPNATEKLYEAKFLILGEGGAGKTSLVKKIQNPDYQLDPHEESTHGIEVIQWCFPLDNGQEFRANLWDFGGQEIYHQTDQLFFTERSLYVLVVDTRKEKTDLPYWLNSIELFGGNSPVLLIKNEKNDRSCNVNEARLKRDFHHIKEVLPTNLKDGRGLEAIKTSIRYHISRLDYVGTPLPKKWVRVRYALENDSRNYIDQRYYFTLCKGNGVKERSEMLQISDFLHKLGVCLHFQKDPVLKHIVILRPEWATNAVYAVVKNNKVAAAKGLFTRSELNEIWQEWQYAHMQDEILQLMQNFKLCYPIPGLPEHYIAPQLLEFDPPDYDWEEQNNLMLRYEYEFMPKGIITQLIVRLYKWIEQQQMVWRSGAVFNNGRARAEVIETYRPYKGEICLQVSGVHNKELLSIVANEIDQINDSFGRIDVSKKIPCNCKECQNDPEPYFFNLKTLYRCLDKRLYTITCYKSFEDVNVRSLTAVVESGFFLEEDKEQIEQERFERLKDQHTEYYQPKYYSLNQTISDSRYLINAQNAQIVKTTTSDDAVIHKYANDPQVITALNTLLEFLEEQQRRYSDVQTEQTEEILNAEIVQMQQTRPQDWQKFKHQLSNLPKDLGAPERLIQASKSALVQVNTDLTDNIFLNAVVAFLEGLSEEPD